MTKKTKTKEYLELMHTNTYRTFSIHSWEGYEYFITFSDDHTRFGYVYKKSDASDKFFEFKVGLNNLLGIHTKLFRLDHGCMLSKFDSFHWSTRLYPCYVHQGLYCKMEKWKEDIKLG